MAYESGIIKLLFPILLGFGKRHFNTIELASCVVLWLHDRVSKESKKCLVSF